MVSGYLQAISMKPFIGLGQLSLSGCCQAGNEDCLTATANYLLQPNDVDTNMLLNGHTQ